VTLQEVADLVRNGADVEVVDAKSKEDVTALVLTQIILEETRQNNFLLPVPLLHTIIKYGDNLLIEFFEHYLEKSIKNFVEFKSLTKSQYEKWLELTADSVTGMGGLQPLNSPQAYQELFGRLFTPPEKKK
jgi:polyhydroxyalkanoate synthesis repressor PhaR